MTSDGLADRNGMGQTEVRTPTFHNTARRAIPCFVTYRQKKLTPTITQEDSYRLISQEPTFLIRQSWTGNAKRTSFWRQAVRQHLLLRQRAARACHHHQKTRHQWSFVLFIYESSISMQHNDGRMLVYRRPSDTLPDINVHYVIDGNRNAARYVDEILTYLLISSFVPKNWPIGRLCKTSSG